MTSLRLDGMTLPTDLSLDDPLTDTALDVTAPVKFTLALALNAARLNDVPSSTAELLAAVVATRRPGTRPTLRAERAGSRVGQAEVGRGHEVHEVVLSGLAGRVPAAALRLQDVT